jgi:hypothetical protein
MARTPLKQHRSGWLNFLGVLIGLAGILTLVPTLDIFEAIFGLGCIVWFLWIGIVMLVSGPRVTASSVEMLHSGTPLSAS